MITDKQSETSRINGARSNGPITPEGKQKSAQNARKHGLTAKMIRRTAEEEPVWQSILNLLYYEHKPFGETEGSLVEDMAYATWQVRAVRESIGKYDIDTDNPEERKRLELLHRYLRQHTRNLEKARAELREQQTVRQTKAELSPDLLAGMPALLDYAKVAKRTRAADKGHSSSDLAAYVAKASDLTPEEKAILENMR
jgi:hypothetical protein